jgi:hypothetical protein
MSLKDYIANLPKPKQFQLAVKLTRLALPIWENYADKNELSYRDTVVGLHHSVDRELLSNSIEAVDRYLSPKDPESIDKCKSRLIDLHEQFLDPKVALQDFDWELPEEVQKTFYAVYNLVESIIGKEQTVFNESTIYVAINQAADALETSKTLTFGEINEILEEFNGNL